MFCYIAIVCTILALSSFLEEDCPTDVSGPVDKKKTPDDIPAEPLRLPSAFEWSSVDVKDPKQMREVYDLLTHNYVEDDDCMFRYTSSSM